jgi:transposase
MGRPKLDPHVTQKICDLIRAGNYFEVAATAAGVHRSTVHRWMRHGREQKRGRYKKFLTAVEKAQAEAESRDVALIAKAASEDWRAAAWRLERKAPRRYGTRVQQAVQQELEAVLSRLEKGLPVDVYEKVLQLIAADDEEAAVGTQVGHGAEVFGEMTGTGAL